jgi:hypothetical protein
MPANAAAAFWLYCNEACLLVNQLLLYFVGRRSDYRGTLLLSLSWLFAPAVHVDLWLGQFSLFTALMVFWTGVIWRVYSPSPKLSRPRRALGTALWTMGIALKGVPILLVMCLDRASPVFKIAIRISLIVVSVSILYFAARPQDGIPFMSINANPASSWETSLNESLWHVVSAALVFSGRSELAGVLYVIFFGSVLSVSVWSSRGPSAGACGWLYVMWVAAFILVFKDVWHHHYCLLLPGLGFVALEGGSAEVRSFKNTSLGLLLILYTWAVAPNPIPPGTMTYGIDLTTIWRPIPTILIYVQSAAICRHLHAARRTCLTTSRICHS